jgi:hypothetical protein
MTLLTPRELTIDVGGIYRNASGQALENGDEGLPV